MGLIQALMAVILLLLGACFGSFLNVCLIRWKNGGQVYSPSSSFCPYCKKDLRLIDNIPLVSFFVLRAKCRYCSKPISWQYPVVEALTAVLFAVSIMIFPPEFGFFFLLASLIFGSFMVLLAVSDFNWRLLPHVFNNLFIFVGVFFCAGIPTLSFQKAFAGVGAALLISAPFFLIAQFFPKSLGGGDVKMLMGLVLWLGISKAVIVLVASCFMSLLFVFVVVYFMPPFISAKSKNVKRISFGWQIPFGTFLAVCSLMVWFLPGEIFLEMVL